MFSLKKIRFDHSLWNRKTAEALLILSGLAFPHAISAQLTPLSDQYILNPLTVNPAYAGSRGAFNIAAFYRRQWVGISGAPEIMTLAADMPLSEGKIGLGLNISRDKIGITRETAVNSNYSYTIKAGKGNLSFGLGAGILATNTAWSDLTVLDPGDEYFLIDSKSFILPDFSFGLFYTYRNYFASASIPRLLQYKFNFDRNKYSSRIRPGQYTYLFHTGYLFKLSGNTKFLPSVFISCTGGNSPMIDLNAHFGIMEKMWIGASYRSNKSVAGLAQFMITTQLKIAYSYYFDFNELRKYSSGSHEIMLRYQFLYRVKVVNPLIF
jgi:type IX secretion system PorP/SprF family membrane protein